MKLKNCKTFLLIAGILCSQKLFAQENTTPTPHPKPKIVYMYLGAGGGIGFVEDWISKGIRPMSSLQTNILFDNSWGLAFGARVLARLAKDTPRDYKPGLCFPFVCPPKDSQVEYSLRLARVFPSSRKQARFVLEAGPSLSVTKKIAFTPYSPNGWFGSLSSNYQATTVSGLSLGLSGRAKAEFPIHKYFGLEIAGVAGINNFMPYTGIEFLFNLGVLKEGKVF